MPAASFVRLFVVSTHSRLKAAGSVRLPGARRVPGFNTQPPEGGWFLAGVQLPIWHMFQHTAA